MNMLARNDKTARAKKAIPSHCKGIREKKSLLFTLEVLIIISLKVAVNFKVSRNRFLNVKKIVESLRL